MDSGGAHSASSAGAGAGGCCNHKEEFRTGLAAGDCCSPPTAATAPNSESYLQVLVQKQTRHRTGYPHGAQHARLPAASSPQPRFSREAHVKEIFDGNVGGQYGGAGATVLLTCPYTVAMHQQSWANPQYQSTFARSVQDKNREVLKDTTGVATDRCGGDGLPQGRRETAQETKKNIRWKNVSDVLWRNELGILSPDDGPQRVEIYMFERGVDMLSSRSGCETCVERAGLRGGRVAARLLAELLAVPRLLIMIPVHVLLSLQRLVLSSVRMLACGLVQGTSDELVKPALALLHNALVHPAVVAAAQAGAGLRAVTQPLWLTLGDALEPLGRVLASVHLVRVEKRCACEHSQTV